MGFSFVTECGIIGREGSGPMGMLLNSSLASLTSSSLPYHTGMLLHVLAHLSSTRCKYLLG